MRLIHCTQKLLKEMGNPALQSIEEMTDTEGLGNWYGNIIRIDQLRKHSSWPARKYPTETRIIHYTSDEICRESKKTRL